MRLAVLLTVHNRRTITMKCLEGLFNQKIPEDYQLDVFMTDDGCTDGTTEEVRKKFPNVQIIQGNGNLYWNRGMYIAWQEAAKNNYDYYLWLNDDTVLLNDSVLSLLEEAKEIPNSVIVGSTHSSTCSEKLTYGGFINGKLVSPNGVLQKCETFNGNIVLIPTYIFKKIGNLNWIYEHALGDLDYGWTVTKSGLSNFISKNYRGICDRRTQPPKWQNPEVPFKQRWENYHSPLGYSQPKQFFHYNRKHFGVIKAIVLWISNHIRLFIPYLWIK